MKIAIIWFMNLSLFVSLSARAEFRIWESTRGDVWEGEFVTMNGGLVVVRDQSGNKTELKPEALCPADLEYLEKMVPPKVNISVSKTTDSAGASGSQERVKCLATLRQVDTKPYSGELTLVLVIMAEDIRTGAMSISSKTEEGFTLPANRGEALEFASKSAQFYKRSQKGGRAYSGYLVVVWDRFGNPIAVESNRAAYEEKATSLASVGLKNRKRWN